MFVSDPIEEVITTAGKVDPGYKCWPRVDTSETFFQIHIKQHEYTAYAADATILLSTPRALLDYLGFCATDTALQIQKILVTTAPHINRKNTWRTEVLFTLEVSTDEYGIPNQILYHTSDDCYSECRIFGKGKSQLEIIYKAPKNTLIKESSSM